MKKSKCKCSKCDKEATFFHSKCCAVHFEGVIDKGEPVICCEKCGKYSGTIFFDNKKRNKKYNLN